MRIGSIEPPPGREVPVLDGIRGVAAIIVAVSHASNQWADGAWVGQGAGQLGVMLFFVLSGFLMGYLYLGTRCDAQTARRFMLHRFGRVVPLFFTIVLMSYAVLSLGFPLWVYPIASSRVLVEHLLFVRGVDVLWSIGPEVVYYLLFLGMWWLWSRSRVASVVFIGALTITSTFAMFAPAGSGTLAQLHSKLPYFVAGTCLGAAWRLSPSVATGSRLAKSATSALAGLLLLLSLPQTLRVLQEECGIFLVALQAPWGQLWAKPYYFFLSVGFFVAMLWARPKWLESSPMRMIGRLSYSIYLVHMIVLRNLPAPQEIGWVGAVLAYSICTIALAEVMYRVVERPAREWFRSLARRPVLDFKASY